MKLDLVLFLKRRRRLILFFGGIFLVFFTWSFILPKINQTFEARRALKQEQEKINALRLKLSDLQNLNEFELSQRTQLALKAIAADKNFLEVLESLGILARNHSLIMESFQVSPGSISTEASSTGSLGKLVFRLTLSGNRENFLSFMTDAEKSLPLLTFGKTKFSFEESTATEDVEVNSYFLPLPTTLGAVDKEVPKLTADEEKTLMEISGFATIPLAESSASALPPLGKPNPFTF